MGKNLKSLRKSLRESGGWVPRNMARNRFTHKGTGGTLLSGRNEDNDVEDHGHTVAAHTHDIGIDQNPTAWGGTLRAYRNSRSTHSQRGRCE